MGLFSDSLFLFFSCFLANRYCGSHFNNSQAFFFVYFYSKPVANCDFEFCLPSSVGKCSRTRHSVPSLVSPKVIAKPHSSRLNSAAIFSSKLLRFLLATFNTYDRSTTTPAMRLLSALLLIAFSAIALAQWSADGNSPQSSFCTEFVV